MNKKVEKETAVEDRECYEIMIYMNVRESNYRFVQL